MSNGSKEYTAGRELDALIAEKVMGYEWRSYPEYMGRGRMRMLTRDKTAPVADGTERAVVGRFPRYSTDITAAWEVVEKMVAGGWAYAIVRNPYAPQHGVKFYRGVLCLGRSIFDADRHEAHYAVEQSTPLAICRAALLAVENTS